MSNFANAPKIYVHRLVKNREYFMNPCFLSFQNGLSSRLETKNCTNLLLILLGFIGASLGLSLRWKNVRCKDLENKVLTIL